MQDTAYELNPTTPEHVRIRLSRKIQAYVTSLQMAETDLRWPTGDHGTADLLFRGK